MLLSDVVAPSVRVPVHEHGCSLSRECFWLSAALHSAFAFVSEIVAVCDHVARVHDFPLVNGITTGGQGC